MPTAPIVLAARALRKAMRDTPAGISLSDILDVPTPVQRRRTTTEDNDGLTIVITFAPLTDVDAPKIPRRTTRLEHDRVLAKIVDSAFAFEHAMWDTPPENWPWRPFDPKLADLFRFVNDRYFQGRIPPHRCFWFDAAGFDDHDDVGITSCMSTMGFTSEYPPHGRVIGLALRLKLAPAEAVQVMRHECCHALVGQEHQHDAEFRRALMAQAEPGDTWVKDECRRYELLDGGIVNRIGPPATRTVSVPVIGHGRSCSR